MRQTLVFIIRFLNNKRRLFIPILFIIFFILPNKVDAQGVSLTTGYDQFICLFEKQTASGKCPNPQPLPSEVQTGAASGVLYGKISNDGFNDQGIISITMKIGLWSDEEKERAEKEYFYGRVADSRSNSFFIRLYYTPQGSTTPKYEFISIPYVKKDYAPVPGDIFRIIGSTSSIIVPRGGGGNDQVGIAFYKKGPSGGEFVKQQTAIIESDFFRTPIKYGQDVTADFWYCGGQKKGTNIDGRDAPSDGERVERFDGRCGGDAAYKIGKTINFTLPATPEEAQASSEQNLDSGITSSEYLGSVLPLCSVTPFGNGSVMGCIAQILYHGIFRPVAFFAQLMGQLFDFFMGYSLSDESYRHPFIQTGWQLVRDISNIFFIIIMIYSGLAAVFSTSNVSYKKVIPTLIINALIINFSLFATRIVIDMSNITSRIFYNQMVVKDSKGEENKNGAGGYKPISEAIVSSFNPQKIFENSVLQSETANDTSSGNTESDTVSFNSQGDLTQGADTSKFHRYSKEYAGYFALVTLVAIAISFAVAMMFWKTAFLFVGRVIGLYVAMIFSPFAFLSRGGVPLVSKLPTLNYGAWWKDLTNYALLAPIFVFFLYIINSFLNVEFFNKVGLDQNGQGFFGSVMYVMIPMLIIYGLVTRGVSIANNLAGEFGKMVQNFATKATGFVGGAAVGVATGGTALLGRGAVSMAGKGLGRWAAVNKDRSIIANGTNRFLQWGQKSSLDIRNTKVGGLASKGLSMAGFKPNDSLAGLIGIGKKDALGGNVKLRQERDKKKEKKATEKNDMSHLTDQEAKEVWEKRSERMAKDMAEKKWEEENLKNKTDNDLKMKALKDQEKNLEKNLQSAIERKDETREKTIREDLAENTKAQSDAMAPLVLAMLEEKKDNKHRKTKEYDDVVTKSKEEIENKYGKVSSTKDLSAAMRYEYAQRMLEDSLYLSKGNKRWRTAPGAGGIVGGLGVFNGLLATGSVGGALFANYIDDQQDSEKRVFEKIVKDFNKAHSKENKVVSLTKKIEDLDNLIDTHANTILGKKISDIKDEFEREEAFSKIKSRANANTDTFKDDYDNYRKEYAAKRKAGTATKADENKLHKLAEDHQKAKDISDALNNAKKDKERYQKDLDAEKDKQKNAEEKKKGGDKDSKGDKPKES